MFPQTEDRSIWAAQGGAVYAEALVCLPVFVALLLAVLGFHGMYSAKLEAKASARRAAWLQADSGKCARNSCPDCLAAERPLAAQGLDPLKEVQVSGRSLGKFTDRIFKLFSGRSTDGVGESIADMPRGLTGSESRMRGRTTLPCNSRGSAGPSPDSALRDACEGSLSGTELAKGACDR
jgi:hypothetical protein